jgi:hypothetical protein
MGDTHFTNADITHNLVPFDGGLDVAVRLYADGRDLRLAAQLRIISSIRQRALIACDSVPGLENFFSVISNTLADI